MTRTLSSETTSKIGETITVKGWVQSRRDHGGLIFVDLRDHTGLTQLVFHPEKAEAFALAESLRDEFVISATGTVTERAPELKNDKIASGSIEVVVDELAILNRADPLPIQPFAENQANEELRLKYRYLDLRRPKMQTMLQRRAEYYHAIREYMEARDFIEVTTPIIANSSPEGARDFLIPSRLQPGQFYALPQAPQQFKQLLMVGGIPRYYQLAACFRDEDPRADRLYGEFYQLDLEMSFAESGEEVRELIEPLTTSLATGFAGKTLQTTDIPRIPHQEAMDRYGSDKPDLRYGMELIDLTDVFADTEFGVFKNAIAEGGAVKAICVKNGTSLSRKQIDQYTDIAKAEGAKGLAYLQFLTYEDVAGPIFKFMTNSEVIELRKRLNVEAGDVVFFGADKRTVVNKVLGRLRTEFADHFQLKDPNVIALCWIVDFPFYEWDEAGRRVDFGHNPFSMPRGGAVALAEADTDEKKLAIVADQYDMVMNGYEICSGAVRNHNPEIMYQAFGALGYSREYVEDKFGAMLGAFRYGAPPHAGCAFGIDRMFMELMGESNIREIVAFPKNGSGVDLMMNSPGTVDDKQLKELSIRPDISE